MPIKNSPGTPCCDPCKCPRSVGLWLSQDGDDIDITLAGWDCDWYSGVDGGYNLEPGGGGLAGWFIDTSCTDYQCSLGISYGEFGVEAETYCISFYENIGPCCFLFGFGVELKYDASLDEHWYSVSIGLETDTSVDNDNQSTCSKDYTSGTYSWSYVDGNGNPQTGTYVEHWSYETDAVGGVGNSAAWAWDGPHLPGKWTCDQNIDIMFNPVADGGSDATFALDVFTTVTSSSERTDNLNDGEPPPDPSHPPSGAPDAGASTYQAPVGTVHFVWKAVAPGQ